MPGSAPSSSPSTCRCPGRATGSAASTGRSTTARCPPSARALDAETTGEALHLLDPALDWAYLERLVASVPVPVVVKGILDREDAILAAEHGAAGIVVSNHGGRQLDGAMPTIEALPDIVDAVGDRLEVLLDSGIRRGTDVATALALGAQAVLAGRMPLWGLASGGEEGAREVLELLREELATALHLMGCSSVEELSSENLVRRTLESPHRERRRNSCPQPRRRCSRRAASRRSSRSGGRCASSSASTSPRRTSTSAARSRCSGCAPSRTRGTSAS